MVFQRPNPFPKSIYDNVAYGLRILGMKDDLDGRVERALRARRALGRGEGPAQEVGARPLGRPAAAPLHRARDRRRARRVLLDEPASALDPISTSAIEDLMHELKRDYTLVIVTHNMQQAARVAEMTAFFSLDVKEDGSRNGILVEYDSTEKIFTQPVRRAHRGLRHGAVRMRALTFTEELAQLEASLQEEGDLVLRALRSSLNALARGDEELADEVIRFDDEVDRRYVAIEEGVQSLLARQTPVAADLRLVLAVLRVNLHLERMADYCVTVAKLTKLMGDLNVSGEAISRSIEDMGQRAEQMIRVAMDAFADRDAEKAHDARRARRADRPREPQRDRGRALARRLARGARVRPAHARRLALRRADRRPRRRHRRAGRLPRHGRVPRVQRRLAPGRLSSDRATRS